MATHEELRDLFSSDQLCNRLEVAIGIKARAILTAGAPATAVEWAGAVLDPSQMQADGERMLRFLLAGCSGMTVADIKGTSDDALNQAVSNAVDLLYT